MYAKQATTPTVEKKQKNAANAVFDQHMRLNYLHQAALFIAGTNDDASARISRSYARHVRECLNSDRVKVQPEFMRTFCKKCKQVFVNNNSPKFELTMTQHKVLCRRCKRCGFETRYQISSILTRNEQMRQPEDITVGAEICE